MASIRGAFGGAQIKGSIGSTTFQQGPSGTIIRSRTTPVNPNSGSQVSIRGAMAIESSAWTNILTGAQRAAWADYALGTPLPNRFGESINVGGRQMYLRTNVARNYLGLSRVVTAPATPGVAAPTVPTLTGDTTDGLEIASVDVVPGAGGVMIVRTGIAVNQARNFYKAPFTLVGAVTNTTVFPLNLIAPAGVSIGQRYFVAVRTFEALGKVSEEAIYMVDVTA